MAGALNHAVITYMKRDLGLTTDRGGFNVWDSH
jgi:hypothetical protein